MTSEIMPDPIVPTRYELIVKAKSVNEAIAANNIPIEKSLDGYYVKGFSPQQAIVSFVDYLKEQLPDDQQIDFDIVLSEPKSNPLTFRVIIGETYSILSI